MADPHEEFFLGCDLANASVPLQECESPSYTAVINAHPDSRIYKFALAILRDPFDDVQKLLGDSDRLGDLFDNYGCTLLSYTVQRHDDDEAWALSSLLLTKECHVGDLDLNLQNALYYAAREDKLRCCSELLKRGCPVDNRDTAGQSALFYAARRGHVRILRFLVEKGAEVDCLDYTKEPPLFHAARHGHKRAVQVLIQMGADPTRRVQNKSAASYARSGGNEILADWLEALMPDLTTDAIRRKRDLDVWWAARGSRLASRIPWLRSATKVLHSILTFRWAAPFTTDCYSVMLDDETQSSEDTLSRDFSFQSVRRKLQSWTYVSANDFVSDLYRVVGPSLNPAASGTLTHHLAQLTRIFMEQEIIVRGLAWFIKLELWQSGSNSSSGMQCEKPVDNSSPAMGDDHDEITETASPDYQETIDIHWPSPELLLQIPQPSFDLPARAVDWEKQMLLWLPPQWPPNKTKGDKSQGRKGDNESRGSAAHHRRGLWEQEQGDTKHGSLNVHTGPHTM